jgi:hypothetical protein
MAIPQDRLRVRERRRPLTAAAVDTRRITWGGVQAASRVSDVSGRTTSRMLGSLVRVLMAPGRFYFRSSGIGALDSGAFGLLGGVVRGAGDRAGAAALGDIGPVRGTRRVTPMRPTTWTIAVILSLLTALTAAPAGAQLPVPVTITGEMLWIDGDTMMVATRGGTVAVDLSAIPLDDYLAIQPGAAVLVRGVWTEGDLLVASALRALPGVPSPAEREAL